MKATPKLIQLALGAIGIGAELEMCIKIHEVVKLLNEKGDLADLSDLAKIAAIQVESEKPQSEPLPSDEVDLSLLEVNDMVKFRDGSCRNVIRIDKILLDNEFNYILYLGGFKGTFFRNGYYQSRDKQSPDDIVKITKPN